MRLALAFVSVFGLIWYSTGSIWGPVVALVLGVLAFAVFAAEAARKATPAHSSRATPKFQAPEPLDDTIRITATVRIRALPSEDERDGNVPADRSQP